jgi:hypothetical protein
MEGLKKMAAEMDRTVSWVAGLAIRRLLGYDEPQVTNWDREQLHLREAAREGLRELWDEGIASGPAKEWKEK